MGETKEAVVPAVRAKRLTSSGVFERVHEPEHRPANDDGQSLHTVPEHCQSTRSVRRETLQAALKALLRNALVADGVSYSDAGAACDRGKRHLVDMVSPDGRGLTGADLVLLARRSESFRAAVMDLLGGGQ